METQNERKSIREEDLTPEQREKWLSFYRMVMQRKRDTQAEMRARAKSPERQEIMRQLNEENAKRGTPYL